MPPPRNSSPDFSRSANKQRTKFRTELHHTRSMSARTDPIASTDVTEQAGDRTPGCLSVVAPDPRQCATTTSSCAWLTTSRCCSCLWCDAQRLRASLRIESCVLSYALDVSAASAQQLDCTCCDSGGRAACPSPSVQLWSGVVEQIHKHT
jgi:hypothetical protein